MIPNSYRGFTLLISIILTSVVLAVGVALLDIAYKQIQLASTSKNSQYAFYNADSALECALFWDQKMNAFFYNETQNMTILCSNLAVGSYTESQTAAVRTTTFTVPCDSGGISASVSIYKTPLNATNIFANGYSTCDVSNPTRIERGLKARY